MPVYPLHQHMHVYLLFLLCMSVKLGSGWYMLKLRIEFIFFKTDIFEIESRSVQYISNESH